MAPFKLAINMPGAISAGAYTAGVLDFLFQALDEWENAKTANLPVPKHVVSIETMTGASAGGMCAAIAAVQAQEVFPHITSSAPANQPTGNRLYDSWVEQVTITRMLETRDLASNPTLLSALDCTVLDEIAESALKPATNLAARTYISPTLTLMLTLSNMRGTYYPLYAGGSLSPEEYAAYFGDYICFQYGTSTALPDGNPIEPLPQGGGGSWPLLQQAALATGAFPVALRPRILDRRLANYTCGSWKNAIDVAEDPDYGTPPPVDPLQTLNVDGGMTDNDPFQLAHDYLLNLTPVPPDGKNPREADKADRAVLSIAPFPEMQTFSDNFSKPTPLFAVLLRVVNALLSQSRFLGESLNLLMTENGFSRFVIAPSDEQDRTTSALQCGALGAFGGFFYQGYRDHDYQLGRRNCQHFLATQLAFPSNNAIIAAGLAGLSRDQIIAASVPPPVPGVAVPPGTLWIPLIPLCGTAIAEAAYPPRAVMPYTALSAIGNSIHDRLKAAIHALINSSMSGIKAWFVRTVASGVLLLLSGSRITGWLADALKEAVGPPP